MTERGTSSGDLGRPVFLSHSSADTAEVERLRAALESRHIACFLDVLELRAGDDLAATLKERVQGARALLIVLSPAAVSSRWVRHEIEWALAAEDLATETAAAYRFIPVFTRGITHGFLGWLGRPEVLGIDANGRALADVAGEIAQALGVLPMDARPRPAIAPLASHRRADPRFRPPRRRMCATARSACGDRFASSTSHQPVRAGQR